MYKYVLLDLDGTITDPKEGITKSVAYALDFFGIAVDSLDSLTCFIGPPLISSFMEYYGMSEAEARLAVEKYRERYADTGIYENKLYPGICEMLAELHQSGCKLVLATSKPTVYAKRILEHFELDRLFFFVSGSELDGSRTIKGEVIRYALDNLGIADPSSAVMIGDRKHDMLGAHEHGLRAIGVLFGYGSREELEQAGAHALASDANELMKLLS